MLEFFKMMGGFEVEWKVVGLVFCFSQCLEVQDDIEVDEGFRGYMDCVYSYISFYCLKLRIWWFISDVEICLIIFVILI